MLCEHTGSLAETLVPTGFFGRLRLVDENPRQKDTDKRVNAVEIALGDEEDHAAGKRSAIGAESNARVGFIFLWWENVCGGKSPLVGAGLLKAKGVTQEQTANGPTRCFFQGLLRGMSLCIVDSF